jgi:hypothetical protein
MVLRRSTMPLAESSAFKRAARSRVSFMGRSMMIGKRTGPFGPAE